MILVAGAFVTAAAIGAVVRYVVRVRLPARPVPFGTLAVNLAGAFGLGLVAGWSAPAVTIVGTAALGALTTFSTLTAEVAELAETRRGAAALYLAVTVLGGVGLAFLGLRLAP